MVEVQRSLGINSAVLVGNPVPVDEQLDPAELEAVLKKAWAAAEEQGVHGQASTPFLLDYIRQATDGRSLDANVALYYNNIRVGLDIATALAGR